MSKDKLGVAYQESERAACIKRFDEMLPDYAWISDVQKVDYFLWGMRH